jgi:hypothetical protein
MLNVLLTLHRRYQYSKTNEMHFLYSVYYELTASTCFRALLVHLQETLHKQQFVYCVRVMSVGCYQDWSSTLIPVAASKHYTPTIYQLFHNNVTNFIHFHYHKHFIVS